MTRVNMVHYVVINSHAPSLDSRIYYNKFDFDHDCDARMSYERRGERKQTRGKRREKEVAVEPRVRDTRVSLEGQGQRYLRYLIGSELLKSREGRRERREGK